MSDARRTGVSAPRRAGFARCARAALEKHVPESRTAAHWRVGTNEAWVRVPRGGGYGYFALRRHLDWVSGEVGLAREPRELGELFLLPGRPPHGAVGCRIRLGDLLHGEDRWWPAGESERERMERLEWLALQLAVRGAAWLRRRAGGAT